MYYVNFLLTLHPDSEKINIFPPERDKRYVFYYKPERDGCTASFHYPFSSVKSGSWQRSKGIVWQFWILFLLKLELKFFDNKFRNKVFFLPNVLDEIQFYDIGNVIDFCLNTVWKQFSLVIGGDFIMVMNVLTFKFGTSALIVFISFDKMAVLCRHLLF